MPDNRVNASDDVIGALSERVADLSKRVNTLQAELEAAQKRLAVYDEFDSTVREAMNGALRAAYQIRERAETTANQILEQAREERRLLLKEVERLREERDALVDEVARARRGGIAAVAPRSGGPGLASEASVPTASEQVSASELRALATEALRSMFKEIVHDFSREAAATAAPSPPVAAQPAPQPAPAPAPQPAAQVIPTPPPTPEPVAERVVEPAPAPTAPPAAAAAAAIEDEETAPASAVRPEPRLEPAPQPQPETDTETAAPERTPLFAVPDAVVEDMEVAPQMAPQREEPQAATADIAVMLSPVPSFSRLVELERRIQTLPIVRSLYVRDFRGGVATLAVGLRSAMTLDEFADALSTLGPPALRAVSTSRNTLELRLEGETSIA